MSMSKLNTYWLDNAQFNEAQRILSLRGSFHCYLYYTLRIQLQKLFCSDMR